MRGFVFAPPPSDFAKGSVGHLPLAGEDARGSSVSPPPPVLAFAQTTSPLRGRTRTVRAW
jgi:hypothetical protein